MLTFLLTDVEGSTRMWEEQPAAMALALARHDAILGATIAGNGGEMVKPRGEGDSIFAVFADAVTAAAAAVAAQEALAREAWPEGAELRVRIALHTGPAELRQGDYYGPTVNRCARLRATAHGGQVVLTAATAEAMGEGLPTGASLADLGHHRLRDLDRAEHVFQLTPRGFPADFPHLRSLATFANNLPQQLTSLVGRDAELGEVEALLDTHQLVSLTGPGGVGKTRLALQVAADRLDRFPDGAWLVELAALGEPAQVARQVAATVKVREEARSTIEEVLVEHFADHQALLLLDNCEQLVGACADLSAVLLARCAQLKVLATSREPLGVSGELAWKVPPLDGERSAQLFLDRARLVRPGWEPATNELDGVRRVCRRLDGIPLAIELAAARSRLLSVEEIERRLEDRLRFLAEGPRTSAGRHRTLRAAIEWSYGLLPGPEQLLFDRLAVFAGDFTVAQAEAVAPDPTLAAGDVLELLARLVDKSLVLVEPRPAELRYRMLETLREFGLERLTARGELGVLRRQLAAHFLAAAEAAEPLLIGPDQAALVATLGDDLPNLRAVLEWARQEDPVLGLRLSSALVMFWVIGGFFGEGREWLQAFAAIPGHPDLRLKAFNGIGRLVQDLGDYTAAREAYSKALEVADDLDGVARARVLNNLGTVAEEQGDYQVAAGLYEESLAVFRAEGTDYQVSVLLNNLAALHFAIGDFETARLEMEEGMVLKRRAGDVRGTALALANLASLLIEMSALAQARPLLVESRLLSDQLGERAGVGLALHGLGDLALHEGDLAAAGTLLREALSIRRGLDQKPSVAADLEVLAELALAEGSAERSLRLAAAAAALRDRIAAPAEPVYARRIAQAAVAARQRAGPERARKAEREGRELSLEAVLSEIDAW